MKETNVKSTTGIATAVDSRARVIPIDLGLARRPFDASAARKCYVIFDKGPPVVLDEVPCGDIIIVETKATFDETSTLIG